MAKRGGMLWFLLLALCGVPGVGLALPLARDASINLITEEWPPYNYTEPAGLTGVSVQIVRSLLVELGHSDTIKLYPSERAKKIMDANPRSMLFSMFRTPQREAQYKWIGPIGHDTIYFYQRKDSLLQIKTLADAKGVSMIACRQAGLVFNMLTEAGFTNLDSSAYNSRQVYSKLLRGRVELAISDSPQGVSYLLKQMGVPPDALRQTPVMVVGSDLYIAASLDFSDDEIARWQLALDRLRTRGVIDQIYREFR